MFRKVEEKDKEVFIKIVDEFYNTDAVLHSISKDKIKNTFNEMISSDRYLVGYLFENEDEVFGYAILSKTFSPEAGGICIWIEEVYIRENYQGKSIGTKFFEFVEREFDFSRVRLEVEKSNYKAQELYKRLGYKVLEYKQMYKDVYDEC